jgi:PPOX class probable F420-dependent enzyme
MSSPPHAHTRTDIRFASSDSALPNRRRNETMNVLPRRVRRALVMANKKALECLRSPQADTVTAMPVRDDGFADLAAHKHCLVVTYRKDGRAVAQPVWPGYDGDRVYIWTEEQAIKAKRLRRNRNALIAPCSFRGKPLESPIAATGRILDNPAERAHAATVIQSQWGWKRKTFAALSRPLTGVVYIELTQRSATITRLHPTASPAAKGTPA